MPLYNIKLPNGELFKIRHDSELSKEQLKEAADVYMKKHGGLTAAERLAKKVGVGVPAAASYGNNAKSTDNEDPMAWGNVIKSAIENVPSSAGRFVKDITNMIAHPIDTVKGVGELALGGVQKLIPGEQPQEQVVDKMVDFYKNRYGSMTGFKEAIAKDPVGVLADGATFAVPGGAALKGAGTMSKLRFLRKAGDVVQKTGKVIDPMNVVTKPAFKAIDTVKQSTIEGMFADAAGFNKKVPLDQISNVTKTALDKSISLDVKGLNKLSDISTNLNTRLNKLIDDSVARGEQIPIKALGDHLKNLERHVTKQSHWKVAKRELKDTLNLYKTKGITHIDAAEAHRLKNAIYKQVYDTWTTDGAVVISKQAQKNIARAAKEQIEGLVKEAKSINGELADINKLYNAIAGEAANIKRSTLFDAVSRAKTGGAGFLGKKPALTMMGVTVLNTPRVKAWVAQQLHNAKKRGRIIPSDSKLGKFGSFLKDAGHGTAAIERAGVFDEEEN